jgi:3-hydroxyacyl-CoA dehydrogenase
MQIDVNVLVLGLGAMGSAALYQLACLGGAPVGIEQFTIGRSTLPGS